jgi:uncharacterized membrane protein YeaQ/YmgE (transglycosylase-associated protein family)
MSLIGLLIAGVIIGLLGKWVAPSNRDNIPIWLTVICGIVGVLVGYFVAGALGVAATGGVDWIRWIISIALAAIFVAIASTLTSRRALR